MDGEEVITFEELIGAAEGVTEMQGFVLAHTTGAAGDIAVSLVHAIEAGDARNSLELWRDETPAVSVLPLLLEERGVPENITTVGLRDRLTFSPDGGEVAIVLEDGEGELVLVDLDGGIVLGPLGQSAFDWSPDGRWLAIATPDDVDVYGPSRDETPTFQLPLVTPALAWR